MAKRRRPRTLADTGGNLLVLLRSRAFRYFLAAALVLAAVIFAARRTAGALIGSPYFRIKTISIDRAVSFINKRDLDILSGKSIFVVDLKRLQRNLAFKYPQMAQVKILKRFPNTIQVLAKKRPAFARAVVSGRTVPVDDQGAVLAIPSAPEKPLPLITGVSHRGNIVPGLPLGGEDTRVALNIIKEFQDNAALSSYNLTKIDVGNLLSIDFYLSNDLKIIVEKTDVDRQIRTLALVLSQSRWQEQSVKYIDLRFKEPILGTK